MHVFPIMRSKLHILRRFLKMLRRRASARLQLLEALDHFFPVLRSLFHNLRRYYIILRNRVIAWLQLLATLL